MSATINSNQGTTVTTTYAWTGDTNASPSVQRVGGFTIRTNEQTNGGFSVDAASWGTTSPATLAWSNGRATVSIGSAALASGNSLLHNLTSIPAAPGDVISAAIEAQSSLACSARIVIRPISSAGGGLGDVGGSNLPLSSSATLLSVANAVMPSGTVAYRVYVIVSGPAPASAVLTFDNAISEHAATPGPFFDGSFPSSSVTRPDTTSPTLILGYETARRSQNLYHDVLGGGQDVTLRPAALRSGTLRLFYPSEADAAAALTMHAKAALFYVDDPDRPSITMYYAVDGTLSLELDQGRNVWTLAVGYQEVNP